MINWMFELEDVACPVDDMKKSTFFRADGME